MSKSISIRGASYTALKKYCEDRGLRVGPAIDKRINDYLDLVEQMKKTEGKDR